MDNVQVHAAIQVALNGHIYVDINTWVNGQVPNDTTSMMDVHVSIEAHVSLEPRISPPTHVSIPSDVSKDSQVQGLLKA
jgi:hypothetical protein